MVQQQQRWARLMFLPCQTRASTQHNRPTQPTQTSIDLRLRYPLMGGWKTDFMLGEWLTD
jgi:hypothetical protein